MRGITGIKQERMIPRVKNRQGQVKGDDPEMTKAMKGTDKQVIQMFKDCVEEEKAWAKHLFKDGSIIGLNERLLGSYVEWVEGIN